MLHGAAKKKLIKIFLKLCTSRYHRISLVVQWLIIHLLMQRTQVRSLVQEDPTCHRTTKSMNYNY